MVALVSSIYSPISNITFDSLYISFTEGVVKNRLNLVANKSGESKLTDEDPQAKSKLVFIFE